MTHLLIAARFVAALLLVALLAAGCGDDGGDGNGGTPPDGGDAVVPDGSTDGADADGSDGSDIGTDGAEPDADAVAPDGKEDGGELPPDVPDADIEDGGTDGGDIDADGGDGGDADVPYDAETGPEDADVPPPDVPPTCEKTMDCAGETIAFVCHEPTKQTFKNTCYAFCGMGEDPAIYEDLVKFEGSICDDPDACQTGLSCAEPDYAKTSGKVCAMDGETEFTSTWDACCNGKKEGGAWVGYDWKKGEVAPGPCEAAVCGEDCPPDFAPICGQLSDASLVTYANSCVFVANQKAECDGATKVCESICGDHEAFPDCAGQGCAPVCGKDGETYFNACFAGYEGGTTVDHAGPCCPCPPPDPKSLVCGANGVTYGNVCLLLCAKQEMVYEGKCCAKDIVVNPETDVPVCGTKDGEFGNYANFACAESDGATCIYEGECAPMTANPCPTVPGGTAYDPVCGEYLDKLGGAKTGTFANECQAGCAGAVGLTAGVCGSCASTCKPELLEGVTALPHCSTADCVVYPNACVPTKCISMVAGDLWLEGLPKESLVKGEECPADCGVE